MVVGHVSNVPGTMESCPTIIFVLLLVTGWFRRYPEELHRTIAPDDARIMCRD
jgi:hypothetical protein